MEWAGALARSLTGESMDLPPTGPDAARVLGLLADVGWDTDRIRARASERAAAGQAWPEPPDLQWCRQVGPARWSAVVADAVRRLEVPNLRPGRRQLTADEFRLLADVPPHW